MTATEWQRVQELFDEAISLPANERAAFLERTCGDDEATRTEIESLLKSDGNAPTEFMRSPEQDSGKNAATRPGSSDLSTGTHIGKYEIKGVIASGGMATVYEAEQDKPRRTVALKVMKAAAFSRSSMRRFEFESQALARLRHPNIAQVYDAGMHVDRAAGLSVPFFAMEYVPEARTITAFADHKRFDTEVRLRLFIQVCEAVHHGHQKGIIHRDLKPANILVDSTGQVKIIDFGVARSTDSDVTVTTMHTNVGEIIGTLQYMSPEQCEADPLGLDIRTDVYSLGVVLYELLTQRLPYDVSHKTIHAAARTICEEPSAKPSSHRRSLRGNLDLILPKALEKDRQLRYQSTVDLAEDLRRYLSHEPIDAKPPTLWTRSFRWLARHPVLSSATASVSVAGLILMTASLSVSYAHRTPYDIRVSEDRREVRLLSLDGNILDRLSGPRVYAFARMVGVSRERGRSKIAIVGFARESESQWRGQLCAFDISDRRFGTPVWCDALRPADIPTSNRAGFAAADFAPQRLWVADIFEQNHGRELVVTFSHRYSRRALRIYALDGSVLYQIWHDGGISSVCWMDRAGILAIAGENAEAYWEERCQDGIRHRYPWVLFAVRPKYNMRVARYVDTESGEDPLDPIWYRCILPATSTDLFLKPVFATPDVAEFRDGAHGWVEVRYRADPGTAATLVIDENGSVVQTLASDEYLRNTDLPRIDDFWLGDLPPIDCPRAAMESVQDEHANP